MKPYIWNIDQGTKAVPLTGRWCSSFHVCLFQFSSLEVAVGCSECITGCGVRRDIFVPACICMSKVVASCFPANIFQEIKSVRGFKGFLLNMLLRMRWFDSQRGNEAPLMHRLSSAGVTFDTSTDTNADFSLFPLLFGSVCSRRTHWNRLLWSSCGSVFRNMDLHYRSTLCCMDSHLTTVACAVCSHATIVQNSSITTLIFASGHWPMDGGALLF